MSQSKYKVSRIVDKKIQKLEKDFGMILENSYKNFLKKYNVVECNQEFAFPVKENLIAGEDDISIDIILGFCKDEQEDIYSVNYDYQDRIPEDVMAIALVNEGDWLCLHIKGQIYYWDHDVNDLYLDIKKPNAYLLQNVDLPLIANSFQEFLEGIVHKERESDEGDCKNISTPISEALLKAYLKNPKIFSYNSYTLKKLELSEKGKEVLALLKKEKLI